jgi:hypothetical protein
MANNSLFAAIQIIDVIVKIKVCPVPLIARILTDSSSEFCFLISLRTVIFLGECYINAVAFVSCTSSSYKDYPSF